MKVRPRVLARNLQLANDLAKKNGGVLPNPWRMIQMGYGGLYRYILRHPTRFEDFKYQEAVGVQDDDATFNVGIRQEHLKTARSLIDEHGKLPSIKWLGDNKHTKLASYMRIHPGVFTDLKQRNGRSSGIMLHATTPKSSTRRGKRRKKVHHH